MMHLITQPKLTSYSPGLIKHWPLPHATIYINRDFVRQFENATQSRLHKHYDSQRLAQTPMCSWNFKTFQFKLNKPVEHLLGKILQYIEVFIECLKHITFCQCHTWKLSKQLYGTYCWMLLCIAWLFIALQKVIGKSPTSPLCSTPLLITAHRIRTILSLSLPLIFQC